MSLISNQYMKALLKTVYLSGVDNLKYQNSPVLSSITKEKWTGGDVLKYAAQYGNGGNFGSVYNSIVNSPTSGVKNLQWEATQGYAFGMFNVNQPQMLTTADERGAFMSAIKNNMAGCFDGLSKTLATYLYGGKWGMIDQIASGDGLAQLEATNNKMTLHSSGVIKIDEGTRFQIVEGGDPSGTLRGTDVICTVTKIDDNVITYNASGTLIGITPAVGDAIVLYTARGSDGTARGFEGLADIIPWYHDRTGASWDTYIAKEFRGVDRSKSVNRLAGQFVKAEGAGDTRLADAMVSLLKKTKRAGGLNNMMIVNDETWDAIGAELGIQKNLWQATDGNIKSQSATLGINELATAFGDAFIGRTVIDPYQHEGIVHCIEKEDLRFYDLGNVSRVLDPVANDQIGKHEVDAVGDQGFGTSFGSNINIDKLFTVEQGAAGEYGPEFRIAAHVYGNFVLRKTASAGVAVVK